MINYKFKLENLFQEIWYLIDNWINEGSGWIVKLIESQCINISIYRPLSGSSYVKLPVELRSPRKGLINVRNEDQKFFLWCHVRHVNPVKMHPEIISRKDKKLAKDLNYDGIEFPVQEKNFSKIETKNNICIIVYCYKKTTGFLIHISNQKFKDSMDLLVLINDDKSHYDTSKISADLCFIKQRIKIKNTFVKVTYNVLVVNMC